MTYAFVDTAVIALRFRRHGSIERVPAEKYAWFYMITALIFVLSVGYGWPIFLQVIGGILTLALLVQLHRIP